jgi:hypothetical protein
MGKRPHFTCETSRIAGRQPIFLLGAGGWNAASTPIWATWDDHDYFDNDLSGVPTGFTGFSCVLVVCCRGFSVSWLFSVGAGSKLDFLPDQN